MMFRVAIFLSCVASNGVAAFSPASVALSSSRASAKPSCASSLLKLADEVDAPASETEIPVNGSGSNNKKDLALLFDCDGVILETEELHRQAYNAVFQEFEVTKVCGDLSEPVEWSVGYYDILQNSIGGGKPKMRHYFSQLLRFESNEFGDPTTILATIKKKKKGGRKKKKNLNDTTVTITAADIATGLETLIDSLQTRKTELYKTTVEETAVPRPGLISLMDEALADDTIAVGVCSASTKAAAQKVLECTLGPERVEKLDVCILGDDVSEKKPSPMIYNAARENLGIDLPTKCVVVEDSAVGLRAAKAAGMRCLITYTASTTNEDFYGMGADAKVPDLVNNGNPVTLEAIFEPLKEAFSQTDSAGDQYPELLVGLKDEVVEEVYDEEDNLVLDLTDDVVVEEVTKLGEPVEETPSMELGETSEEDPIPVEDPTLEEEMAEEIPSVEPEEPSEEEEEEVSMAFEEPVEESIEEILEEPEPASCEPTLEEVEPEQPEEPEPAPPKWIMKPKMTQDDMGNFSM